MEVLTFQPQPVGHLTLKSAHIAGNLIKHFLKSQMPGGLPGGEMIAFGIDPDITIALDGIFGDTKATIDMFSGN